LREEHLSRETKRIQAASGLLICGLQQRLLSSIDAFARTLRVHQRTVARQWEQQQAGARASTVQVDRLDLVAGAVSNDDERANTAEDVLAEEVDEQVAAASATSMGDTQLARNAELFAREQALLDEMTEVASASRG